MYTRDDMWEMFQLGFRVGQDVDNPNVDMIIAERFEAQLADLRDQKINAISSSVPSSGGVDSEGAASGGRNARGEEFDF